MVAFDPNTGAFIDYLRGSDGKPLTVEGVWALTFGDGVSLGDAKAQYYSAGPNKEFDGVFGRINVASGTDQQQK
jgi:hypothetical protein